MNLYTQLQHIFNEQYGTFIQYSKKPYVKEFLTILISSAVLGAAYFGYTWYQERQDMHAFAALIEISKSYENAIQKYRQLKDNKTENQTENPWEDTQLLLQALSSSYKNSRLAPFFIMYEAEVALYADNDYEKACKLMDKGVRSLPKGSIYTDMFNLKRLKMLLDSPMQDVRDAAVIELTHFADQKNNYYAHEALFVLGSYYAYYAQMDKAIEAWKKLAQEPYSEKSLLSSSFVQQAQEKLKTLHVSF